MGGFSEYQGIPWKTPGAQQQVTALPRAVWNVSAILDHMRSGPSKPLPDNRPHLMRTIVGPLYDDLMVSVAQQAGAVIETATRRWVRPGSGNILSSLDNHKALQFGTRLGAALAEESVGALRREAEVFSRAQGSPARDMDKYMDTKTSFGREDAVRTNLRFGYTAPLRFALHAYRDNEVLRVLFTDEWQCAAALLHHDDFITKVPEVAAVTRRGIYRDHFANLTTIDHPETEHWRKVLGLSPTDPVVLVRRLGRQLRFELNPKMRDALLPELRSKNATRTVRNGVVQNDQKCPATHASRERIEAAARQGMDARSPIAIGSSITGSALKVALGTLEPAAVQIPLTRTPSRVL